MAITTLAELRTAVGNWLVTSYASARIDEWVALAEGELHGKIMRRGGIRDMEATADLSLTADDRDVDLPTRYRGMRRLYLDGSPVRKLNFVPPITYWETYLSTETSKPVAFTIEGDSILFGPIPDATYTGKILFYQGFAPLTDAAPTNDLLTNNPQLYLTATLKWAWTYKATTQPEGTTWDALMRDLIDDMIVANNMDRFSGDVLEIRPDTAISPQF